MPYETKASRPRSGIRLAPPLLMTALASLLGGVGSTAAYAAGALQGTAGPTPEDAAPRPPRRPSAADLALSAMATSLPDRPPVSPTAPRDPFGHADLSGYWKTTPGTRPIGNIAKDLPGFRLPYTAAGDAAHQHNLTQTIDPEGLCLPSGIPRQSASALPFAILQTRDKVAFLYWQNNYRVVFVDGRAHPVDPPPQFFGYGVGAWDGDTLVIDSVGFKDSLTSETWADENGDAHSDALHTVERWTRLDAQHLAHRIVIEDPKYLTQPVTYSRIYSAVPAGQEFGEYICDENNIDRPHLQPGPGPIRPDGTRGYDVSPLPALPPSPDFYERRGTGDSAAPRGTGSP